MTDPDPIVAEVRRIRDAHAAKFNYDPRAIFRDIKERERSSGRKYVSFADERRESHEVRALGESPLPSDAATAIPDAPAVSTRQVEH
jgi:hypothetical protein